MKKSTGTTDRKLALSMAVEWEKAAIAGKQGTLVEARVRKVLSEILEQATGQPLHYATVADFFADWLKDKQGASAKKTAQKHTQMSQSFLTSLGSRSKLALAAIGPADIRKWSEELLRGGRAPSTVNTSVRVVSSVFEQAKRLGYIPTNPCNALTSLRDDGNGVRDTFTPEQVRALVQTATGTDWEGAVLTGFFTGLRLKDVSVLQWDAVDTTDAQRWFLRVIPSKTRKGVAVPVHPELRKWLESQPRGIGKAPLFSSLTSKSTGGHNGLSSQFKRLMERAGVLGKTLRTGSGAGRSTSSLSFHSLRHSFTSAMTNAGVAEEVRMLLTGHATKTAHKIYTHHQEEQVWDAIAKIPGVL
jgi:integrase